VARSSVNDAGALIQSDVISENARDLNRQKRMLEFCVLEVMTLEFCEDAGFLDAAFGLQRSDAIRGKEQLPFLGFDDDVFRSRDGTRALDCAEWSKRSGPDDGGDIGADFCVLGTDHGKFDPDGRAGMVFMFNFCFGERG